MPKLDNGNMGVKFGHQIDKKNDYVGFEDSTHSYFDLNDGSKYYRYFNINTTQG